MVVIRLSRGGAKKRPFYKIIVADKRMPRDGRFIEHVGTYDPRIKADSTSMNLDRIDYWLKVGAQPSDTVASLIRDVKASKSVTTAA